MPDPAVTALTGYRGGDDSSGKGGRTREAKVMQAADDAVTGGPAHPAAAAASAPVASVPKPHPSSYAPSDAPAGPRVYGSPIEGNAASK